MAFHKLLEYVQSQLPKVEEIEEGEIKLIWKN